MTTEARRRQAPSSYPEEAALLEARATDPTHWRCPTCFQPCRCVGAARLMPHEPCGVAAERR